MKRVGRTVAWVVTALTVVVLATIGVGSARLAAAIEVPPHDAPAAVTAPERQTEGGRLANAMACTQCHGTDLAGSDFLDGGPFMRLPAPNLTGGRVSAAVVERAVRHGIGSDGRALLIMPSQAYAHLSDDDMADIAGYIASLPDTPRALMQRSVGPIGRAVAAFQATELQPARITPQADRHPASAADAVSRFTRSAPRAMAPTSGGRCSSPRSTGGPRTSRVIPPAPRRGRWSSLHSRCARGGRRTGGR
ncbi:MAG: cytochrome c [Gemmatimonadetes bacterium]|nr:cytochrome c [Gemmatimonadota bacterium]